MKQYENMDLKLETHYWDKPSAKSAFKKFILDIHGLDFSAWDKAGFWDKAHTPFSFFKNGQIISSISIYLLDAIISGRSTRLVQISGVGTSSEWRKLGLSRELTNIGLEWAKEKHEGIFLFADEDAIPYYEKTGFNALDEYIQIIRVVPQPSNGRIIKLDPAKASDLDEIYRYARQRAPLSDIFSIMNAKLLMFHVLYFLKDHIYAIPDLNILISFKHEQGMLKIFDIIGAQIPKFEDIYPYISSPESDVIEFHFHTDKLDISAVETKRLSGNHLFVRSGFPLQEPVFPYTSRA